MNALLPLLAVLSRVALAADVGRDVSFSGAIGAKSYVAASPAPWISRASFQTADSDLIPEPFDALILQGVTEPGVAIQAARREASGVWTRWVPALVERSPSGRFWARVVFPSVSAGSVRVRGIFPSGPRAIEIFSLETFVATAEQRSREPEGDKAPPLGDAAPLPTVRREDWGARLPKEPYEDQFPERMTQHHTEGRYPETLEDSVAELRFIQSFHQNGRGWNDIGYHYLVDAAGRIFEGRPETAIGAHVRERNPGNIGVALLGSYHPPRHHALTPAQREALRRIGVRLRERYRVSPSLYAGHRDYTVTACPGDDVYAALGDIRESFRPAPPSPMGAALRRSVEPLLRRAVWDQRAK